VNFPTRISALSDVPTFTELGYPALSDVGWMALWSTPDVPAAVQARVRELTLLAMKQPKVQERIKALGMENGLPLSSEELSRDLRQAHERQGELLRTIYYKPE
jgi:tripartite-type tricarboxylate transporter receptor subunit TctC